VIVPRVNKYKRSNDVLVERALPGTGNLTAKVGDRVEPFTKLGMAKVSYGSMDIDSKLKLERRKIEGGFFYTGEKIGKVGSNAVIAPFDGTLLKEEGHYTLKQEQRDFWLLSGVWGEVKKVQNNESVLIKTQTTDFSLPICTPGSRAGELIVFPNPSELLEMQYIEKFAKDIFGKLIYVGNFAKQEALAKAHELGASGMLAGSVDRAGYNFAKQNGMFLGVFSGFGRIPTPKFMFDILKEVSNRYIFVQGERKLVRIPAPEPQYIENESKGVVATLEEGSMVQVFESPHFGWIGRVSAITKREVHVVFEDDKSEIKVKYPNLIAVE
jgi:hypothetical protein